MLKMLIVEDERLEREGLCDFFDWEEFGLEIAGTACDGIEGIEMAHKISPDIIITDIKMPGIDGINMSKKIREFLPNVKIIILTGYDDFTYAKEAISFNANEYILKPVEEEEMLKAIQKVVKKCESEKKRVKEEIDLRKKVRENSIMVQKKIIMDFFDGKLDAEEFSESLNAFQVEDGCGSFSVIAVKPLAEDKNIIGEKNKNTEELTADYRAIFKGIEEIYISYNMLGIADEREHEILICVNSTNEQPDFLSRKANEILKIYAEKNTSVLIGIGNIVKRLSDVSKSCCQARQALIFEEFWCNPGIRYYKEIDAIQKDFDKHIGEFLMKGNYFSKQLIHAVRSSDEKRMQELLEELFKLIIANKGASIELVCNYLYSIINEVELVIYNINHSRMKCVRTEGTDPGQKILAFKNIQAAKEYMFDFFERVSECICHRNNKDDDIIKKVIQIIQKKYMEDINQTTIAGEVFLSPNYLGYLFKKSTGKTIKDFLCEYRMEKAKELLTCKKNKVSWVAQQIGIPNTSYFCTIFKNTYGITPGAYQEMVIRNR